MKAIFTCFLCLVLLSSFAQQTFQKSYGAPGYGENYDDMAKLKGNTVLITGSTSNFGAGGFDAWCIKIDNSGKTLWSKTYGDASSNTFTKCTATADGGFVMCFTSYKDKYLYGDSLKSLYVVKCNVNGQILWCKNITSTRAFTGSLSLQPYSVLESKSGDIYVLSEWRSHDYYGDYSLLKLDTKGDYQWNTDISLNNFYLQYDLVQMTEKDNGELVIGVNLIPDDFYTFDNQIQMLTFSPVTGENTLSQIISQPYNNGYGYLSAYDIETKGNTIVVFGYYGHDYKPGGLCRFLLNPDDKRIPVYYSPDQSLAGRKTADALPQRKRISLSSAASADSSSGGYIYAYSSVYPDYNIIVAKTDNQGRVCPDFIQDPTYDTSNIQKTFASVFRNSNYTFHYAAVGRDTTLTITNVKAEKTICEGYAPSMTTVADKALPAMPALAVNTIQVYPNPASDKATVAFETAQPGMVQFTVTAADGKKVILQKTYAGTGKQQVTLPVRGLSAGVYYLQVNGSGFIKTVKFVKE